ncbi:MAG: TetR/AcrR family transcriptional regulator [Gammaproteobacteria bacterium]|nr:TetR/AcrR family transcriptional regulator [Gammaproteobacteria bacterium]
MRLIQAAHEEFLRDGFRGASVDRIAASAGVAKQTLYNNFPSKEALFAETVRAGTRAVVVKLDDGSGDVRERLVAYGQALRAKLLSPEGLAWFRTLVADLPRLPQLGRIVLREGPMETQRHLAAFLAARMDSGELRRDDPIFAAEMLNGMLLNSDRTRGLFADDTVVLTEPARVERILDCFLRAFRPE